MCRMCDWLGDGQVWYMNPKNYANRMYKLREPGTKMATSIGGGGGAPSGVTLRDAIEARANVDIKASREIIE